MNTALLLIDLQNDYFPGGKFPLWNTDATLQNCLQAINQAQQTDVLPIHIQHIANPEQGIAPFFNQGTSGAEIHPAIKAAAPNALTIQKAFADSFHQTELELILDERKIKKLLICGMMTQNCVTHTAISKTAEKYDVSILTDCCTSVNKAIHLIALHAVSTRCALNTANKQLGE